MKPSAAAAQPIVVQIHGYDHDQTCEGGTRKAAVNEGSKTAVQELKRFPIVLRTNFVSQIH